MDNSVMKSWVLIIFFLLYVVNAFAQKSAGVYKTKNGVNIAKNIPYQEQYQSDDFAPGKVFFRNGRIADAKLNYNLFYGEIEFIGPKNDTLLLTDNDFIDSISIGREIFYYLAKQGHIRKIAIYGGVRLGEKMVLAVLDNEREAAYNHYSATSAISNYKTFSNQNGETQWMKPTDKVVFKKEAHNFLIDKNQQFYVPSKTVLQKLFRTNGKEITVFIKDRNINFSNQPDLITLLKFCSSLTEP